VVNRQSEIEAQFSFSGREAQMKQRLAVLAVVAMIAALCVPPVFAQATATVKGVCRDSQGKPIAGATVEYYSAETGRKYQIKTNNKGEYFSLGIQPGKYKVSLIVDGKVLFFLNNVPVSLQEEQTTVDLDVQKEAVKSQGQMTEEQRKAQEAAQKEVTTVKTLNEKLAAANTASQAGDYDQAIALLTEATQVDATRDLLWFKLGDAYRGSATKQTDSAEKARRFEQAVEAYTKAVAIKPTGAYYNNLGEALAKSGKVDDAVKAYNQAAQVDPAGAGQYYFNLGAIMTNTGKVDEAIAAFDKAIAADPTKAEAYYWKGVNMIGKATLKGDKMVAPEGTAEALQKYLELAPTGQFAQPAKDMLASIGSTVETSFGKKKGTKK
jgi:tetratricopeptide (TPR) repeat protein